MFLAAGPAGKEIKLFRLICQQRLHRYLSLAALLVAGFAVKPRSHASRERQTQRVQASACRHRRPDDKHTPSRPTPLHQAVSRWPGWGVHVTMFVGTVDSTDLSDGFPITQLRGGHSPNHSRESRHFIRGVYCAGMTDNSSSGTPLRARTSRAGPGPTARRPHPRTRHQTECYGRCNAPWRTRP